MVQTKYGVISDIHKKPSIVPELMNAFRKESIDRLILNGDLGDNKETIESTIQNSAQLGVETYVQPGSHEKVADYIEVIDALSKKFSNIVDVLKNPKIKNYDHYLVFLPGSDWNCGGQFTLTSEDFNGYYIKIKEVIKKLDQEGLYQVIKHPIARQSLLNLTSMNSLTKLVNDTERTIAVCHIPRKFDNLEEAVDMAYFAERPDGSLLPGIIFEYLVREKLGYVEYSIIEDVAKRNSIKLKRENRGNVGLKEIYERNGIKKAISGHFHESGHRANDLNSNHVEEGLITDNLFYNPGCADEGKAGIFTVEDNKISYKNIKL